MIKKISTSVFYQSFRYNTIISNMAIWNWDKNNINVFFAYFTTVNVHYDRFNKLLKSFFILFKFLIDLNISLF